MKKSVFVTQFSFSPLLITKEKNNGLRLTVEGQSYTCRELVEKHKVGQMPPVQNSSLRFSDNTIIGNPVDIVEVQNAQLEFEHYKNYEKLQREAAKAKAAEAKAEEASEPD